ncbi:sigma-54-dependent transcriptional regulator [Bacteroidota bacterium]
MRKTLKGNILIVDDNHSMLNALDLLLQPEFEKIHTVSNPNLIPQLLREENYDVVLLDMNFTAGTSSGNEGLYWLREIFKSDEEIIIILITAYGDISLAVKAMKEGATDFVLKPWDDKKLIATLQTAIKLRQSKREVVELKNKQEQLINEIEKPVTDFIGCSEKMNEVFTSIQKVAGTDANVLIIGENGTGKELVARELHRQSKRKNEVFVSVDVGSLSETLFESELFGHNKGAFTDAKSDRAGRFETASGGTLFLDEIGNLSVSMQSKLLTALQNRSITRLGSNKSIDIDIRLICATNKNLNDMIRDNLFREDLFYRINTIQIEVPPLRERGEDIIRLTEYFLNKYSKKYEKPQLKINSKAINKLDSYYWPGNVRELEHTVEKAVIMCDTNIIGIEEFFISNHTRSAQFKDEVKTLEELEKESILKVLKKYHGNHTKTSKELNIARTTLLRKIKKYNILDL